MNSFNIIVAVDKKGGISKQGDMPWKGTDNAKTDLTFFKNSTLHSILIMGRKTWESIGSKSLPERTCIVVTSKKDIHTHTSTSFENALKLAYQIDKKKMVWVCGGVQIYKDAIEHPLLSDICMTQFEEDYKCDLFFPYYIESMKLYYPNLHISGIIPATSTLQIYKYSRNNLYETQYNVLVQSILQKHDERIDRTKIGTLSTFGSKLNFNLENGTIPLLTCKKVFWRGIVEELLWFISGSTDANVLKQKNIHIWDGNSSRAFLDEKGFTDREEGDLGPVYGFQWRHFGATYKDHTTDYTNQGIDQLQKCIDLIRNEPTSRRIVLNAWNVSDLDEMVLPPCHMMCQFYVEKDTLRCQMYQRSADIGLGVPFNIASYSLLTHMMAHVCGLKAKELIYITGDTHIYKNHVKPLKEQIQRKPRPFPIVRLNNDIKDMDDFKIEDIQLHGYHPHPNIKMNMAI